jgi:hypothetical protein
MNGGGGTRWPVIIILAKCLFLLAHAYRGGAAHLVAVPFELQDKVRRRRGGNRGRRRRKRRMKEGDEGVTVSNHASHVT